MSLSEEDSDSLCIRLFNTGLALSDTCSIWNFSCHYLWISLPQLVVLLTYFLNRPRFWCCLSFQTLLVLNLNSWNPASWSVPCTECHWSVSTLYTWIMSDFVVMYVLPFLQNFFIVSWQCSCPRISGLSGPANWNKAINIALSTSVTCISFYFVEWEADFFLMPGLGRLTIIS
jgi:hypothetical protein